MEIPVNQAAALIEVTRCRSKKDEATVSDNSARRKE